MFRIKFVVVFISLIVAFSFLTTPNKIEASVADNTFARLTLQKKKRLERIIIEHKSKINELGVNLFNIEEKTSWVELKIAKMIDQKLEISTNLQETVKNLKIQKIVIENELNRLMELAQLAREDIATLNNKIILSNGGKIPIWWPLSEKEKELIKLKKAKLAKLRRKASSKSSRISKKKLAINKKKRLAAIEKKRQKVKQSIKSLKTWEWIDYEENDSYIMLSNKFPILFDSGETRLNKKFIPFITKFVKLIKKHNPSKIEVIGHIDKEEKKNKNSNIFGMHRAKNVSSVMIKQGIKASLFKELNVGDDFAKAKNIKDKIFDRKVDIIVYIKK